MPQSCLILENVLYKTMENKTLFGRYSSMRDVKALLQKLKIITLNSLKLLKRVII